ncbi:MAG: M28 family metallopeptidase [Armatimonadota bacterium]
MMASRRTIRAFLLGLSLIVIGLTGTVIFLRQRAPALLPRTPAPSAVEHVVISVDGKRMKEHVKALAGRIGVRRAGTESEAAGGAYLAQQFAADGYAVKWLNVPLTNGRTSKDVYVELPGKSPKVLLIGAHYDSKPPAPGANDNASGVAVVLELAHVLHGKTPPLTLRFVGFGAEERIDGICAHHHFGSRKMAVDPVLRARLAGMVSLDMVGVGTVLHIDNVMGKANRWRDYLSQCAKAEGLPVQCGQGNSFSDHEAFEHRGIPVAYLHWEKDIHYHRRSDRPEHVQSERLAQTARVMVRAVMGAEVK